MLKHCLSLSLATLALSTTAHAGGYAYQWNSCSSSGCSASTSYAYNSAGGTHSISRTSAGRYSVSLGSVGGAGGNVQVVAYGTSAVACNLSTWGSSGSTATASVRCNSLAGTATDSSFVILYQNHPTWYNTAAESAYLWTSSTAGAVSSSYSYNSTGGSNTVAHPSTGTYTVTLNGLNSANANVLVTPYGTGTNRCRVGGWSASSSATTVTVQCNTAAGVAADSQFALSVATGDIPVGIAGTYGANYGAWAYVTSAASISSTWCTNTWSGSCDLVGTKVSTGRYKVMIPYVPYLYSAPLVSTYGSTAKSCRVRSWAAASSGSGTDVYVDCYSGTGTLSDTAFTLVYNTFQTPLI